MKPQLSDAQIERSRLCFHEWEQLLDIALMTLKRIVYDRKLQWPNDVKRLAFQVVELETGLCIGDVTFTQWMWMEGAPLIVC